MEDLSKLTKDELLERIFHFNKLCHNTSCDNEKRKHRKTINKLQKELNERENLQGL